MRTRSDNRKKKLRVASRGLKWENKTYKLKRSIPLWRLARFLVSGPEFHSTALCKYLTGCFQSDTLFNNAVFIWTISTIAISIDNNGKKNVSWKLTLWLFCDYPSLFPFYKIGEVRYNWTGACAHSCIKYRELKIKVSVCSSCQQNRRFSDSKLRTARNGSKERASRAARLSFPIRHINLFSLYVLFSHFRPRDATRGNSFFQMLSYARANVRITNETTKGY